MKSIHKTLGWLSAIGSLLSVVAFLATMFDISKLYMLEVETVLMVFVSVSAVSYLALTVLTFFRQKKRLKIAVIGGHGAGKTMFITVLLHKLHQTKWGGVQFRPYWSDTQEAVELNRKLWMSNHWPVAAPTEPTRQVMFRVDAIFGIKSRRREYTLEILEVVGEPGESIGYEKAMHAANEQLAAADGIIVTLDGKMIAEGQESRDRVADQICRILNRLRFTTGTNAQTKINTRLAIVVLKADLLPVSLLGEKALMEAMPSAWRSVSTQCANYRVYFISAISQIPNGLSATPKPVGDHLFAPLFWLMDVQGDANDIRSVSPQNEQRESHRALIIGVDSYSELPTLSEPVRHAMHLGDTLGSKYGFAVTALANPTHKQVLESFSELISQVEANDTFLFYFSGHGNAAIDKPPHVILTADAQPNSTHGTISLQQISAFLGNLSARNKLLILDTSVGFEGQILHPAEQGQTLPYTSTGQNYIYLASGSQKTPVSHGDTMSGAFSSSLIDVLEQASGPLNVSRLGDLIQSQLNVSGHGDVKVIETRQTGSKESTFYLEPLSTGPEHNNAMDLRGKSDSPQAR
jgi:hypothetical protein